MTYVMTLKVRTEHIDGYPELLEAYKRSLGQAMTDKYGVDPNWDTYRRLDLSEDPISPPELHGWSSLEVEGKEPK